MEQTLHRLGAIDRRGFLAGAGALLTALPASAAVPPHRFRQGAFEIIVVSDGHLVLPANIFGEDANKDERNALLKQAGQGPDLVQPLLNVTLIRTPSDLILVDTGAGANFQPTAGQLADNLAAGGIDPASVTKVVYSHAHPDHLWGTIDDFDELRFPNARFYIGTTEHDFWFDRDLFTKLPEMFHPHIVGARRNLTRIADKLTLVKPDDEIVSGVRVLAAPGHTPGHITLEIAGDGGLIVSADAISHALVSFAHPEWRFAFDTIPDLAITTRKTLLDRAAAEKMRLLGYHWPYPGVGHVERKDNAYRFVAA